ncbi:uncharacterized protein NPIL_202631 [Nephila pilipes]|uniref:Uncharacterized protein n=1 Tax=Nephila pilipes TaxID=299642 RepID=A0A8X6R048_NEPPI|nr:uncharacterized protein NPIL_202631 [Nephila pilipes]
MRYNSAWRKFRNRTLQTSTMSTWMLIFAACVSTAIAGRLAHDQIDEGEYGKYNEWRKVMCEKKSDDLYNDMNSCFKLESKMIQDATTECVNEIVPETEGKVMEFVHKACDDKSLFKRLDECFGEYEANVEFQKQMELKPEIVACYTELLKKYEIEELMHYLDGSAHKEN